MSGRAHRPLVFVAALVLLLRVVPAAGELRPESVLLADSLGEGVYAVNQGRTYGAEDRVVTGLEGLQDVCVGPRGEVYATTQPSQIRRITAGGDLSADAPFATGLVSPRGLACTSKRILVANRGTQAILDATEGGDLSGAAPFATGLANLVDVLITSDGTIYASSTDGQIYDVTAGGDFTGAMPFATGGAAPRGMTELEGRLLVADGGAGTIVDFTAGGDLSDLPIYASLADVRNIAAVPLNVFGFTALYAAADDSVYKVLELGGDLVANPFAHGFEEADFGGLVGYHGCGATPKRRCASAAKGSLSISERKAGREKWRVVLSSFDEPVSNHSVGFYQDTHRTLCLYDDEGRLAGQSEVFGRSFLDGCLGDTTACWKRKGTVARYRDADASAGGVTHLLEKQGPTGGSAFRYRASNDERRGRTRLETGVAALLEGASAATVQVSFDEGRCFEARLDSVRKNDGSLFKAKRSRQAP